MEDQPSARNKEHSRIAILTVTCSEFKSLFWQLPVIIYTVSLIIVFVLDVVSYPISKRHLIGTEEKLASDYRIFHAD